MSFTVSEVSDFERRITLLLDSRRLDAAESRAARRLARDIHVNGFRRGKAPRRMVERVVGRERVRNDAIEDLLSDRLPGVWEGTGLAPAVSPVVDGIREVADGVEVDLLVSLWPTLATPPVYEGRTVELDAPEEIGDEAVGRYVDMYREQFAELETVERPCRAGDYVAIDLSSSHDGRSLEAPAATGFLYELGVEAAMEGLTEQLTGCEAGAVVEFEAPLRMAVGDLAEGTVIEVRVVVDEVREKLLPDLDDEWVADFTDFDTVSELREQVFKDLDGQRLESLRSQLRGVLLSELAEEVELDIPQAVVDASAMRMFEDFRGRLDEQKSSVEEYLEATGQDIEAVFGQFRGRATAQIQVGALLDSVAEHTGIEVRDEDILDAYQAVASRTDQSVESIAEEMAGSALENSVRGDILRTRALDILMRAAVATDGDGAVIDLRFDPPGTPEAVEDETE
ncbi:MAG: trigger factor [bacterium]|nr:trigger factor [bacterium]